MANVSFYLEALRTFNEPVTVRDVYSKAVEMFGEKIQGDRGSARQSLERCVLLGRAEKRGTRYIVSASSADPVAELQAKVMALEIERRRLFAEKYELEKKLAEAKKQPTDNQ